MLGACHVVNIAVLLNTTTCSNRCTSWTGKRAVWQLFHITWRIAYHIDLTLKSYVIDKYPLMLISNEIAPFMSTE